MKTLTVLLSIALLIGGCGYKPKAKYARNVLGSTVSVGLRVNMADPENAVIAKDAILSALISRFKVVITPKGSAVTHLDVFLSNISETELQKDANGYVVARRITTQLSIVRTRNGKSKTYTVAGIYDFRVEPNATVSDNDRFKAIKLASLKAVDSFIAQLAVEG